MATSGIGGRLSLLSFSHLLLLLLLLALSSLSNAFPAAGEQQREFDYFALALQWPGTYCQRTRHCCPSNGCCRSSVPLNEFTIHGLWPDYNDGSWPSCCSKSYFDIKKISSLIGKLGKYWPSLSCGSSSLCHRGKGIFWAHEWEKHGTCSFPVIKDEFSYFSTVLDLYSKYNITKVLDAAGFSATNADKYPLSDVIATIRNATGGSPLLVCAHDDVQELRLCFDKGFKPRDCEIGSSVLGDVLGLRGSCPRYISFPVYTPLVAGNGNATVTWLPDSHDFQLLTEV